MHNSQENLSMEQLLELYGSPVQPQRAQLIEGEVVAIDARLGAFVDFGGKSDALLPADELAAANLTIGDRALFQVVAGADEDGMITLSHRRAAAWSTMRKLQESGTTVNVRITRVIGRSGVRVESEGLRGFVPTSMLGFHKDLDQLVDSSLEVKVAEVDHESHRLIFDHLAVRRERADAARAAEAAREERFHQLKVGEVVEGTVAKVADYGLFVDVGNGLNGLLHNKELKPGHGLTVGSAIKVRIVRAEKSEEGKRLVALSLKRTQRSPLLDTLKEGDIVEGTVSKVVPYGVFVSLGQDTEGLVHRSQLPSAIRFERRTLTAGEAITVRVTAIDAEKNRISLSLKDVPSVPPCPQAAPVA